MISNIAKVEHDFLLILFMRNENVFGIVNINLPVRSFKVKNQMLGGIGVCLLLDKVKQWEVQMLHPPLNAGLLEKNIKYLYVGASWMAKAFRREM